MFTDFFDSLSIYCDNVNFRLNLFKCGTFFVIGLFSVYCLYNPVVEHINWHLRSIYVLFFFLQENSKCERLIDTLNKSYEHILFHFSFLFWTFIILSANKITARCKIQATIAEFSRILILVRTKCLKLVVLVELICFPNSKVELSWLQLTKSD